MTSKKGVCPNHSAASSRNGWEATNPEKRKAGAPGFDSETGETTNPDNVK
jgi:hypothetical protein